MGKGIIRGLRKYVGKTPVKLWDLLEDSVKKWESSRIGKKNNYRFM